MRVLTILLLALTLVTGWLALTDSGLLDQVGNSDALRDWVIARGTWGPLLLIALMTGAIVFSPIPSAPIALAAGAVFGHGWGTLYIVIGAELGAMTAFLISRLLGYPLLRRWIGAGLDQALPKPVSMMRAASGRRVLGWLGTQNGLMAVVLGSRLLPFLSFDLVSYAAGLTPLTFPRFALATLIGIVPISFLLAHFGDEITAAGPEHIVTAALLLGLATGIPLLGRWLWLRLQDTSTDSSHTASADPGIKGKSESKHE